MIPRALPKLMTDAVRARWDVRVEHGYGPSVAAIFVRGDYHVRLEWWWKGGSLALSISEVNTCPTPYTQCTRLIRSPEGATS